MNGMGRDMGQRSETTGAQKAAKREEDQQFHLVWGSSSSSETDSSGARRVPKTSSVREAKSPEPSEKHGESAALRVSSAACGSSDYRQSFRADREPKATVDIAALQDDRPDAVTAMVAAAAPQQWLPPESPRVLPPQTLDLFPSAATGYPASAAQAGMPTTSLDGQSLAPGIWIAPELPVAEGASQSATSSGRSQRPRPSKFKRQQVKLLAERVFQAQVGTDEERESAERLFLEETSQDALLADYAWKVFNCLNAEAAQRRAQGESEFPLPRAHLPNRPVSPSRTRRSEKYSVSDVPRTRRAPSAAEILGRPERE